MLIEVSLHYAAILLYFMLYIVCTMPAKGFWTLLLSTLDNTHMSRSDFQRSYTLDMTYIYNNL